MVPGVEDDRRTTSPDHMHVRIESPGAGHLDEFTAWTFKVQSRQDAHEVKGPVVRFCHGHRDEQPRQQQCEGATAQTVVSLSDLVHFDWS